MDRPGRRLRIALIRYVHWTARPLSPFNRRMSQLVGVLGGAFVAALLGGYVGRSIGGSPWEETLGLLSVVPGAIFGYYFFRWLNRSIDRSSAELRAELERILREEAENRQKS